MPELLLELLSEEIPARMQTRAAADLERLLTAKLTEAGFPPSDLRVLSGPRRLTAVAELPARSADVREERKGPRVDAPEKALQGFMRGAGLTTLDACETRKDKRGAYYVAVLERPGRPAPEAIAEIAPEIVRAFPWPKSMRWGEGSLRWVRPLQRIVCLFDGAVVHFEIDGIEAGNATEGHRVMGRGPFLVTNFASYRKSIETSGHVRLDAAERKALIAKDAARLCQEAGLELVDDEGLLNEVAGLAEWPTVLLGEMDPAFLDLPPEVIRLSMRTHQKYFAVRAPKSGALAPRFVVVADQLAPDRGAAIAAGNARVLSARLSDARHFWDNDRATPLADMAARLKDIVFHAKLGSMADKTERVAALARELAPTVGADAGLAEHAARLAKADLVSEMVYEFPELQGVMGRYYALAEAGLDPLTGKRKPKSARLPADAKRRAGTHAESVATDRIDPGSPAAAAASGREAELARVTPKDAIAVADAIRDHYRPQGPSDEVPTAPVSIAVALADKLDTLVGFWVIGEKPTGSGDPYALRRAALGVVRTVLVSSTRLSLLKSFSSAAKRARRHRVESLLETIGDNASYYFLDEGPNSHPKRRGPAEIMSTDNARSIVVTSETVYAAPVESAGGQVSHETPGAGTLWDIVPAFKEEDLLHFFADRLKVHLREEGHRHDLVDAVFALGEDDLVLIVKRVEALGRFLETEDGANLLAAAKRAANIVRAEEKKGFDLAKAQATIAGRAKKPEAIMAKIGERLVEPAERELHGALVKARADADATLRKEDFEAAMGALSHLRAPVDAFFDEVTVNADDEMLRLNRLLLLSQFRDALGAVADFSKVEG